MKKYIALLICMAGILQTAHSQVLKVMSYNIHVGQDASNADQLKNMADFIRSTKADLIGLQEVDSVCNRSDKVDQMKFLAGQTGMFYAYARHFAFDGGSYGIGILSKYPLSNVRDHRVILTSSGTADAATRALLSADILVGSRKVTFATVHMDYRDSNSRQAQSEEMVRLFSGMEHPVILTGDFNARPGSAEVLKLQTIFSDSTTDSALTFPADKPRSKIDYIMVSKAHLKKTAKQQVSPVLFSDHLPVMSTIRLKK